MQVVTWELDLDWLADWRPFHRERVVKVADTWSELDEWRSDGGRICYVSRTYFCLARHGLQADRFSARLNRVLCAVRTGL